MKTSLSILFTALLATAMINAEPIPNPAIDYAGFARLTIELQPVREKNRITEDQFIQMSAEPKTVILDARSKDRYSM